MIDVGLAVLSRCCEGGHNGDGGVAHAWLLLLVTLRCRDVVHGEEVKVRADGRERRLCVGAIAQTAAAATNGTVNIMDGLSLLLVVVVEGRRGRRGWRSTQTDACHLIMELLLLLLLVGKLELLLLLLLLTQDVIDIEDLLVDGRL